MRFFMISDLHLNKHGSKIANDNFQALYTKIRQESSPDEQLLFIVLGDIIDKGDKEGYSSAENYFTTLMQELHAYRVKFEFIPGNHDLVENNLSYFDGFIRKMGADYSFSDNPVVAKEYSGVNLIFADSTLSRDYKAPGELDLEAIRSTIKKDKQNILFCHHALTHGSGDVHNCIKNGISVGFELRNMGINYLFHSHTHTCEITLSNNTVFEIGCGSISQDIKDMSLIYNQFSVGGIRDGKIVSIERWVKTKDGVSGFTYESLYPRQRKFADPETIGKKQYADTPKPHIERLITQNQNDNALNYNARVSLIKLLGENDRIFLLGDAGDGKTIELKKLAHDLYDTSYFPVYFSLRNYTGNEIKEIIPGAYCDLKPNRLVIILDGYDEIQEKYRNDFQGKLNVYMERNPSVRVVVSSRRNFCKASENSKSRTLQGFEEYVFSRITDNDIQKYLNELEIDSNAFYNAVRNARVDRMIHTPFYLDGLAMIYLKQNQLPSKNKVMEEIIRQRFINDDEKFINGRNLSNEKLELFRCLEKLAFAIQLMGTTQITDEEYQDIVPFEQRGLIKLSGLSSQINGSWLFTHNILREYLAAKCLVKMPYEKVLGYCCFDNCIKPSWLNTFGFVIGLSDDVQLKDWAIKYGGEALVKNYPDNLNNSERFEVFTRVFEKYEQNYINSYEGLCSEDELAEFACNIRGIEYLIQKINSPVSDYSLHNALRIMQHLPKNCGKKTAMRDCLVQFCEGYPHFKPYNYRCAIHAICSQNLSVPDITKQLMTIFGTSENDYIRTGMYEYLVHTNEQDNYVDYFLDGIRFVHYRLNLRDSRIGNESWALIEGLNAMSTAESISKVLIWFCDSENPDFYKYDEVFGTLVSKCSKLYKEGNHELFNVLYKCWLKSALHYRHKEVSAVSDFFRETDTYADVVLRLIGSDTSQGLYLVSVFESCPEIMVTMEHLYIEDKLPDSSVFAEFVKKYCRRAEYERFSKTIYNIEGKALPKLEPLVDYEQKEYETSCEYLSCLLDQGKYRKLIDALLTKAGDIDITVNRVSEVLTTSDYNSTLQKTIFSIARYSDSSWLVKDFFTYIRWRKFVLDEVYFIIKNDSVQLDESQKSAIIKMILDECAHGISDKAVSEHIYIVIRLLVIFDIALPQTELSMLTKIPWCDFSDSEEKKFAYLERKYTRQPVIEQVVRDVKNGSYDQEILAHHIDYLRESGCEDIVDEAREICLQNSDNWSLRQSAIKYLYALFGHEYIEYEVLPNCDTDMIISIAQIVTDISRKELKSAMEKLYFVNHDTGLQRYLISFSSKIALEDYLKSIRITNSVVKTDGSVFEGTTEAISCITDPELIPLLEELWKITFNPGFEDREFNGLSSNLYKAYVNCANTYSDCVVKSIDTLLKCSKSVNDRIYCHRLKNEVVSEAIKTNDKALPIWEVKQILSTI